MNMIPRPVRMLVSASQADGAVPGVPDQFVGADGVETAGAAFLLVAAMPQADHEQARGIQQFGEDAECPFLFGRGNMHPDRAQQDEVEAPAQGAQFLQVRQRVVEPGDVRVGLLLSRFAQIARLDGEYFPALPGQPVGVAAGARAYVAGETGLSPLEMLRRPSAMNHLRVVGVVLLEQRVPVLVVVGSAAQGDVLARQFVVLSGFRATWAGNVKNSRSAKDGLRRPRRKDNAKPIARSFLNCSARL